jgi:alpha-tubulin suppressor-like RCC1 family protein
MSTIRCAGVNMSGELGIGSMTDTTTLTDVALSNVTGVAIGRYHACAWRPETTTGAHDQIVCWGDNTSGQLGDGSTASRNAPIVALHVGQTNAAFQVAVGVDSSCAILAPDHSVWCWGNDASGQTGGSDFSIHTLPIEVLDNTGAPLTGVRALTSAPTGYCSIVGDPATAGGGQVWCWGVNAAGEIAPASCCTRTSSAVRVGTLTGVVRVSLSIAHACALLTDHSVWCWGSNRFGQLGNGTGMPIQGSPPVRVLGPASVGFLSATDVVVTNYATCAIASPPDGNVYCWGSNGDLVLGYPGATTMLAPGGRVAF